MRTSSLDHTLPALFRLRGWTIHVSGKRQWGNISWHVFLSILSVLGFFGPLRNLFPLQLIFVLQFDVQDEAESSGVKYTVLKPVFFGHRNALLFSKSSYHSYILYQDILCAAQKMFDFPSQSSVQHKAILN